MKKTGIGRWICPADAIWGFAVEASSNERVERKRKHARGSYPIFESKWLLTNHNRSFY